MDTTTPEPITRDDASKLRDAERTLEDVTALVYLIQDAARYRNIKRYMDNSAAYGNTSLPIVDLRGHAELDETARGADVVLNLLECRTGLARIGERIEHALGG